MLEQELKFTVTDGAVLDAVLASPLIQALVKGTHDAVAEHFLGVYYDTSDLVLEHRKCSLRARLEGKQLRAALKMPGRIVEGLSVREEFEIDLHDWPASVRDFPDDSFRERLSELIPPDSELVPRIEVDMRRRTVKLKYQDSLVELVLDEGEIRGGGKSLPVSELELELKKGDVRDVLSLGKELEEQFPLVRSTFSKHEIGLRLCE